MKILWIHSHFYNWMGGTKFVLEVVKSLKNNCDVEVLIQNGSSEVINKFEDAGIVVNNLSSLSTNSAAFWALFSYSCSRDINKVQDIVGNNNFDTIISSMFPGNYIASNLKDVKCYQYCYEPYAAFWDEVSINNQPYYKRMISRLVGSLYSKKDLMSVSKAEKVFTLSPETQIAIKNIYARDSIITRLGVDTDFYKKTNNIDLINKYSDHFVILHNTDFSPAKRTTFLLDAVEKIYPYIDNIKLLITCSVNNKDKIKALSQEIKKRGIMNQIDILGFVDYDLLPAIYSLADIVVYPGTSNGGGASAVSLFVLEAMACGPPSLRSNDSRSEVLDKVNGELFNPLDLEEFCEICISLFHDPVRILKYSARCREYVVDKYSWDSVALKIISELDHQN